jgi:hypothetical protein
MKTFYTLLKKVYAVSKLSWVFAILLILNASYSWGQTTLFNDNFNSNNSATFSTTGAIGTYPNWSLTRAGVDWGARVNSSQLELSNDASASGNVSGWVFGYRDINALAGWNTTLSSNTGTVTWEFNMQQIRTDPAGFGAGSYGAAFILAGTSTTSATAGSGYAVVLGQSGATDPIRLAHFNNGLQGTVTNLITSNTSGLTDFGTEYLSVRVTYVPGTNTWGLFLRNDGASFVDPATGSLTSQGTIVNNTYTATAGMRYIGGYWQGSTAATQTAFFDNVYLKNTPAACTAPTTQASAITFSSVGTNQLTLNWTNGNGAGRVVLAKVGSAVDANPTNGANPTANLAFGSGTQFGTGNFTVFNGTGSGPITITGLNPNTTYHFRVYEYCSPDRTYNTNTATNNPNSTTTQCSAPSTQASNIVFSSVSSNQFTLNWTNGDGAGRVVLIKQGAPVDANPADGSNPTANLAFGSGTQFGTGNYTVFNGIGSGPITITGLNPSTTYHVRVYEYCSPTRNYNTLTATNNPNSQTTTVAAVPALSANTLTAFGSQCINGTFGPNTFTITGTDLTSANVTVSSLSGYEFATVAGGPYSSSLSLTQAGGAYSQLIYVRFIPTAAIAYNGNIVVGGGGASSINVAASGSGINGTVALTTTAASAILTTSASSGGTAISTSCGTISAKGVVWGLAANPTIPSPNSTSDGSGTSNYTSSITGLTAGTNYNFRAYATNSNGVTSYGSNLTFTTLSIEPGAHAATLTVTTPTSNSLTLNFSAASTLSNANGYIILQRIGASPTGLPVDATGYIVGNTIGDATVAAIITNTATTSTVVAGLSGNTNYHFTLIPFGYNGSNTASYNYRTAATIPSANGTTLYSLTPGAGDVAFTAFQTSAPDGVEFITLRRLDLRQVYVTDNGILSTNAMRSGEGTFQFPNTSAYADIPAGTIIRLDEATGTDDTDFTEGVIQLYGNGSTVLGVGNFALSTGGDQIIMYTGSAATPSFIGGIGGADAAANWNSGATSTNDSKAPGTSSDFYMGTPDNGYYNSSVTGNANTIRSSAVTSGNWTTSGSAQAARFGNKNILFNESNFSAGSISISGVSTTSMTVDVSGVSFTDEAASSTRYVIVIRDGAAPTAPVDRYTCYTGTLSDLTANFGTDPTIKSATTDVCTGTDGNGKVVYLGYAKPSALVINGLTGGTTYHVGIYALNGNGRSANFSTTGLVQTQVTNSTLPTLTTTALAAVTPTTVSSGGNISSDGGSVVTARGVVWNTTSNPVLPGLGSTSDGAGTGSFASSISSLSPETQYNVRAYATNSVGTAYGNNLSFYTLSNQPVNQATNLVANPLSSSSIELVWDAADFPLSGATVKGYVLIRATAPSNPTFTAINGQLPAAGVGIILSSSIIDPTATFTNTGLASSTTYNYLLVPYTWDGVNPGTYHYLTASAPTATATTLTSSCTAPTVQASAVTFGGITTSGFNVNWTVGDGNRSLVIIRANAPVTAVPVDGAAYTSNATFGLGSAISPGEFVVYNSTSNAVAVSGLASNTTYHIAVYAFNVTGSCYLVSSAAVNSATTLPSVSIIETFEPGTRTGYTPSGNATCNLGVWNFNDALIGTSIQDKKNNSKSARLINNGSLTMQFDKPDGVGTITVQHAVFSVDGASTWVLEVSNNGGASFDAFVSSVYTTNTASLTPTVITANVTGDIRIRIRKLDGSGNRMNIDDIAFTNYIPSNTISTSAVAGSPYCITDLSGASINVGYTATGLFNVDNIFIAQLSDETGSFATPVEIGTLAATTTGSITAEIPAGTFNGTGYRIRVISTSPAVTGTNNGSNLQVFLNAPDLVNFSADVNSGTSVTLNWTNPGSCFDEILIVGRVGDFVTALPTGNGGAYTANSVYGTGGSGANLPAGEFAVYKNAAGVSVTLTGMTAGTTYFFEAFTRKGSLWSTGVVISTTPFDPAAGDFRTIANGNYSNASTWQTYNGTTWVSASTYPNSAGVTPGTATVTIRSPHTVVLDVSRTNQPIKNLIVQSGARIWTADSTYNSNRYLTIYGNITCNGNIGRAFNKYDNISFNIEGNPTTISGIGAFNASRLRKNSTVNQTSEIIIAMNMGLKFASGVGSSSGTNIYNNVSGDYTLNLTINENTTVSLLSSIGSSGNISIDGIDGEGSGERNGTFRVNGTLNIPGTLFVMTDNLVAPVAYEIGTQGVINCVNICTGNTGSSDPVMHSGSQIGGATLRILNGGILNLTGGQASDANTYNKPFSLRTNTVSPYTYAAGLGTDNNTFDFQPGSIVRYSSATGTMPVQSQVLTYSNLVISGAATKTINSNLNINRNLTIESPAVFNPSGFNINVGGDWNNYATAGFNEAAGGTVLFNGTQEQNIYCPGGENFNNVQISNSSTDGVVLRNDVTLSNNLDLGSNGRLFFGPSPSVLTLSNMADASNTLLGSGTARLDMTGANHILNIGCQSPSYSGTFDAGDQSIVNYNRNAAISTTTGNQSIVYNWTYANLYLTGSDDKTASDDFTVNRNFLIDGSSTELLVTTLGKTMFIGGDITLTAGGSFNANCFDNLSIITQGNDNQVFNGGVSAIRCFQLQSVKSNGGIQLTGPANVTTVLIKSDLLLNYSVSALFADQFNLIEVGDDAELGGTQANYNLSGTMKFTLAGTPTATDAHISNASGTGMTGAEFNNIIIEPVTGASVSQLDIYPISGGQILTIKKNLDILNTNLTGTILHPRSNTIRIQGNWGTYSDAGFNQSGSTVEFISSADPQTISSSNKEVFDNVLINTNQQVLLNAPIDVSGTLTLNSGKIQTGAYTVHHLNTSPAALGTYNNSSYINGNYRRNVNATGTYAFPVGNAANLQDVVITLNSSSGMSNILAYFTSGLPATLPSTNCLINWSTVTNMLNGGYWTVEPNAYSSVNYGIELRQRGYTNFTGNSTMLGVIKRTNSSSPWQGTNYAGVNGFHNNATQTISGGVATAIRTSVTSFSDFGIGFTGAPLPVQLTSFDATVIPQRRVLLNWVTASELNSDYFEVQRSIDAVSFETIGKVASAGFSISELNYLLTDENPYSGISYYRLKQVDTDGRFTFSAIRKVDITDGLDKKVQAYPNPVGETLYIEGINNDALTQIVISDISGRVLISQSDYHVQQIRLNELPAGHYLLSYLNNSQHGVISFIKK